MSELAPNFKLETTVRPNSNRPYWLYVDAGERAYDRWKIDENVMHIRLSLRHEPFKFDYNRRWTTGGDKRFKRVVWHLFKFNKEEDRMFTVMTQFGGL